jgi:hypothetical protein
MIPTASVICFGNISTTFIRLNTQENKMPILTLKLKQQIDERLGRCLTVGEHNVITEYLEETEDLGLPTPSADEIIGECI